MDMGKSVAVVYGALGPEARRSEVTRFRTGCADILVATDAIGMGMNIGPLRRVFFSTLVKFDGQRERLLSPDEIRQIGGRAGRYGSHDEGVVGVLAGSNPGLVEEAITSKTPASGDSRSYIMPPYSAVAAIAKMTGSTRLTHSLMAFSEIVGRKNRHFRVPDMSECLEFASVLDDTSLPLEQRFRYIGCPIDLRSGAMVHTVHGWAKAHASGSPVTWRTMRPHGRLSTTAALQQAESTVKLATAYAWLARRWPDIYLDTTEVAETLASFNAAIAEALAKSALWRVCEECGKRLPRQHRYRICDSCHESIYA